MHGLLSCVRRSRVRTYRQGVTHGVALTIFGLVAMVAAYHILAYGFDRQYELDSERWERNERLAAEWGDQ
ncbi:MAG TPA: hypothetical protein DCY02_12000 [Armatimonadetes bacterium]|nr:hypothetical protein [Armatimonadota bacterium]HCM73599.1 hypothetical protein [Armatimonadota bacterium]